ncbi:MAG: amylo-alpha-1,6-glucosidase [Tepidisphaeraceae bacterium]|jgi:predicted glycogen debranching enzyme
MARLDLSWPQFDEVIVREWLLGLGNGAYASSTVCNCNTRKYHGLFVASMASPVRRMVVLSRVDAVVRTGGQTFDLATNEYPGAINPAGHKFLRAFSHEPFPRWGYQGEGWTIEQDLRPLPGGNTVLLVYTLLGGHAAVELDLHPLFALRGIHELMHQADISLLAQPAGDRQFRIPATLRTPEVFFAHDADFVRQGFWYLNNYYRREEQRGYDCLEDLWAPGIVRCHLNPGQSAHFVCSTEPIDFLATLQQLKDHAEAAAPPYLATHDDRVLGSLLNAAHQHVVRMQDGTVSVMSGYPYAPAGGRDAMICLPGLLLVPGRLDEARGLLDAFAGQLRGGIMPSLLAEDGTGWRYLAADTSLWFINSVWAYLRYGGDESFVVSRMLPVIQQIIDASLEGAGLGVKIDDEGLFYCGNAGEPTSWMDARTIEGPVTPRIGRPVCAGALWYNALRIGGELWRLAGRDATADRLLRHAQRTRGSFNRLFWNSAADCCHDVIEDQVADASIRPNQILAVSLPFPVLDASRHRLVLARVMSELLTPVGVRTLSPSDPKYRGVYAGGVVARDRAQHQGSAFPWLLGPLVTAHMRVFGRNDATRAEARAMLSGCLGYMLDDGNGHICELFDGDAPHRPGGNLASARSVSEVLRCVAEDVLEITPQGKPQPSAAGGPVARLPI